MNIKAKDLNKEQQWIVTTLISKYGYSNAAAFSVVDSFSKMSDTFKDMLRNLLKNDVIDFVVSIHGYTMRDLIDTFGLMAPGAVTALSWLEREPEVALKVLKSNRRGMVTGRGRP